MSLQGQRIPSGCCNPKGRKDMSIPSGCCNPKGSGKLQLLLLMRWDFRFTGPKVPLKGLLEGQSIYYLGTWTLRDLGVSVNRGH